MLIGFYILFKPQVTDLVLIFFVMIIVCYAVGKTSNGRYLFRYINGAVKKLQQYNFTLFLILFAFKFVPLCQKIQTKVMM